MLRLFIYMFIVALSGSCASGRKPIDPKSFVDFINQNKVGMKMDNANIVDRPFVLKIPLGLKGTFSEMSGGFMQVLEFDDRAKIVTLYIPGRCDSGEFRSDRNSIKKFKDVCEQEQISDFVQSIDLTRGRFFGINKFSTDGCFYIMYLNVKERKVEEFEYSINSIQFGR